MLFELKEGDTLSTTCIIYGNPTPYIRCYLVNELGVTLPGTTTKREQRNYTSSIGSRLMFHNVRRSAFRLQCLLDGGPQARRDFVHRLVVVDCKYLFVSNSS